MLIPVPGVGAGVLTPQGNLPTYVDQLILGHLHYGPNTWFLSYMGFGASVMLGVLAGQMLMSDATPMNKFYRLLVAGRGEPCRRNRLEFFLSSDQADVDQLLRADRRWH